MANGIGLHHHNRPGEAAGSLLFFFQGRRNLGSERLLHWSKETQPVGVGTETGTQVTLSSLLGPGPTAHGETSQVSSPIKCSREELTHLSVKELLMKERGQAAGS